MNINNNSLWTDKYAPKCLDDMLISNNNKKIIKEWMESYKKNHNKTKKILLLSGPPGTGKSTLANILLKEYGYRVIEYNSSELRGMKNIQQILDNTLTYKNVVDMFKSGKSPVGVVLDEIDTLSDSKGEGKGGLKYLLELIKNADGTIKKKKSKKKKENKLMKIESPIICTYNDFKDKKLTALKKYSIHIPLKKIPNMLLEKVIDKIAKNENFTIDFDAKIILMNYSSGDIRRLINLLYYTVIKINGNITLENVETVMENFDEKTVEMEIYEMTKHFLNNKLSIEKTTNLYFKESMLLPLMIHDNFHKVILTKKKLDKKDIKNISDILGKIADYDEYQSYAIKHQDYQITQYNGGFMSEINTILSENRKNKFVSSIDFARILNKTSNYYANKKKISKENINDYNLCKEFEELKINVNKKKKK